MTAPDHRRDVFISHASEDKDSVAKPLADFLVTRGLSVWLDSYELTVGDSLSRAIERGLATSRFGVVVISQSFFAKEWPRKELAALAAREDGRDKVLLPVWHQVAYDDVLKEMPLMADKLAASTDLGIDGVGEKLLAAIKREARGAPSTPLVSENADKAPAVGEHAKNPPGDQMAATKSAWARWIVSGILVLSAVVVLWIIFGF